MFQRQLYYIYHSMRIQWQPPEELRALQEKRLRRLIDYTYRKIELYHRKFRELNVTPSDFRTLEDIQKFPLVTKADLRENFPDNVVSRDYDIDHCPKATTSGSTGQMLPIVYSRAAYDYYMAVTYRNFAALGFKPWHRYAYLRYEPIKMGTQFYENLGIMRRMYVSVFLNPEEQLKMVREFQPHAVTGYPSMMVEWAKISEKLKEPLHPLFIRSEAEILTKEAKDYMENVFGCKMYDEYGSAEFVLLAFECMHGGYHIPGDTVFVEFLRDGEPVSPGEEGDIYVTSLVSYAMPFIRYRMNDRGIPLDEMCSCGRNLPQMKLTVARDDDFLLLPSGKKVNPRLVIPPFELTHGVREFRIVQEKRDFIRVDVVPSPAFTEEEKEKLKCTLLDILGEPVEIVFDMCSEIPRGRHNRPRPIQSLAQ